MTITAGAMLLAFQGCNDSKNPTSPGGGGGGGGAADHVINIVGNAGAGSFSPSPDTVTVGQTVAWKNLDSTPHTATSDPSGAAFNTGSIGGGATSAAITMGTAGSFPYHCSIHPSMTGILVVKP
ncbi:MAG TPA: cupredoxin domain-containing protein [Candidatus Eisenbacteria bacterium]|nr:cupredoxin domain-containing protein [Candidatus Eisenbacteria bacterium]